MKNPLLNLLRLGALLLAVAATALHAQSDSARIKFSDPSQPGTLKFNLRWADVRITGTDGDEVVVSSSLNKKKEKGDVDKDGFRRLDDDVTFELKERNNVVTISVAGDQHWMSHGTDFIIEVPRNTHLNVRTQLGGDIVIRNINGDIDVNSMNGEVHLADIGSSAIVNTMNGEVLATFAKVPAKPISITTMNGEIDLRLPGDTKANLRMRTHNGSIRTNFSDGVLVSKTEKTTWRSGGRYDGSREDDEVRRAARTEIRNAVREARNTAREVARSVAVVAGARAAETPAAAPRASEDDEDEDSDGFPIAPMAPMPPMPPGLGGKMITGTLNGGGVDISLSSMNGTITLRRSE